MINNDITLFDNTAPIADSNRLLELVYEKFVLDSCFRKNQSEYIALDSTSDLNVIDLASINEYFTIDSTTAGLNVVALSKTPFFLEDVIVIIDGVKKQIAVDYTVTIVNGVPFLDWNGLSLEVEAGDKLFVSYSYETPWTYNHTPIEVI